MNATKARRKPRGESEITIEREACQTDYTVLPNAIARDKRLKPIPGFVLYYILSKPQNWKVVPSEVAERMGLRLPAVRKALTALIKLGYGKRDLVRNEAQKIVGTRYFFASWPKYAEEDQGADASEASTGEAVSQKTVTRQNRATEKATPVLSNDSNKLPPKSPHAPEPATSPQASAQAAGDGEGIRNDSGTLPRSTADPTSGEAAGLPRKDDSDLLRPVTFADAKRQYEAHNSRKLAKAEEAWPELSVENQLHAVAVMPQYFAHCARIAKKPVELWRYLRLGVFRQYPPPKKPGELPPPKELPPDPMAVLATELGLRAAEGRFALELVEFIEKNRRIPEYGEVDQLARTGAARHRELIDQERQIRAGDMIGPMVPVLLGKRRMLIAKALRMHGRSPPDEAHADPPTRSPMRAETDEMADFH